MTRSFVEIFEDIDNAGKPNFKTKRDRVAILQEADNKYLRDFLRYAFHPNVKFLLPKGKPPFTPSASSRNSKLIYGQMRYVNYLTNEFAGNLTETKREQMFIGMLESVTPEEADLLCQMKEKKMTASGCTKKLVQEAFPGLLD
jgi:hypothetical protein